MTVGRRPKPTAVKLLEGNPGKRKLNKAEPKPDATKPTAPKHLQGEARKEWNRASKLLHQAGLLTSIDRAALAAYATAYGRWADSEEQLKKHGPVVKSPSGYPIQNPYLGIANKAMCEMRRWLVEFGMTPSSRSRLAAGEGASDELDDFLNE